MSKYVVKGLDNNRDVVITVVCPLDDISYILDTVNDPKFNVSSVRVSYLDPDVVKE